MFRIGFAVALLASLVAVPGAFAQGNPPHNAWCLQIGTGTRNCVFATLGQCQAARHGNSGHCSRNR